VPDDDVQLVKIIRENAPDIVIVNFQVHPDSVGGSKIFSDFPVFVRRVLEGALRDEKDGMGVYVVYFNGTQGDTNNSLMVGTLPRDMRKPMNIGRRLAGAALSVYTYAEPMKADKVYYGQKTVNVEVNKGTPEQLAHAKEILKMDEERHDEFIEKYPGMEGTTAITEAKTWLNNESEPDNHGLYVTSVGFGDVAFVGFPGEPFTEIGRQLKKQSQFKMTIPCCCANGYQAYFPTVNAFEEGGYEIRSSRYKKGTAEKLLEAGIELTKRFKE